MASFPEIVLRVRFRCQQFIKYMASTVPKFPKQSFICSTNYFLGSRRGLPPTRSSGSSKEWLDALAVSRHRKAPPRRELWDDDWLKDLLQKWYPHAVWTQNGRERKREGEGNGKWKKRKIWEANSLSFYSPKIVPEYQGQYSFPFASQRKWGKI